MSFLGESCHLRPLGTAIFCSKYITSQFPNDQIPTWLRLHWGIEKKIYIYIYICRYLSIYIYICIIYIYIFMYYTKIHIYTVYAYYLKMYILSIIYMCICFVCFIFLRSRFTSSLSNPHKNIWKSSTIANQQVRIYTQISFKKRWAIWWFSTKKSPLFRHEKQTAAAPV